MNDYHDTVFNFVDFFFSDYSTLNWKEIQSLIPCYFISLPIVSFHKQGSIAAAWGGHDLFAFQVGNHFSEIAGYKDQIVPWILMKNSIWDLI